MIFNVSLLGQLNSSSLDWPSVPYESHVFWLYDIELLLVLTFDTDADKTKGFSQQQPMTKYILSKDDSCLYLSGAIKFTLGKWIQTLH